MTISAPSPGQLVQVRRRQFIVQDVHAAGLVRTDLARLQHRVRMSSIEEDSLGEELEVIWEIEPGASILHGASALPEPTGLDRPDRFDAFLDAVRWGAIDSGDPDILQSPFRAGIQIEDYQLDPVARALRMPRVNLLIADDVGLGKTIEAGLVVEEYRQRLREISGTRMEAVLAVDCDPVWLRSGVCNRADINLTWPPQWLGFSDGS